MTLKGEVEHSGQKLEGDWSKLSFPGSANNKLVEPWGVPQFPYL
jgi:hypothetical protein